MNKEDQPEIIIKVNLRNVRAKKEVLVKESKYFEALFSGNFKDSSATEINMSKDVEDMDVFKSVIEYMSTKHIFISEENVQQILHYATYLLIDSLHEVCEEYLKQNYLVCENWIKYYFCVAYSGLSDMQQYLSSYISSRFHDLLIFEDQTLLLEPGQLDYFWNNGYMKYCSCNSLILFLSKWLRSSEELEERKLTVARKVLENMKKDPVSNKDKQLEKDTAEAVEKLSKLFGDKHSDVTKILTQNMKVVGINDLTLGVPAKTTAIFTVSERQSLIRKQETKFSTWNSMCGFNIFDYKDVEIDFDEEPEPKRKFDICVYSTQTDSWYHLVEFNEREFMKLYPPFLFDLTIYRKDNFIFEITACDSHLIVVDRNMSSEALIYSLENKAWHTCDRQVIIDNDILDNREGERVGTIGFYVGRQNTVYLVVCVKIGDQSTTVDERERIDAINLKVYHFDLESLEFFEICSTSPAYTVPYCSDVHSKLRKTKCHISESRKEMIIAHYEGSGLNIILLVNLAAEEDENGKPKIINFMPAYTDPSPKEVLKVESDFDHLAFKDVEILETTDKYLIVENNNDYLSVKYSYSFDTETLTKVEKGEQYKLNDEESSIIRAGRSKDSKLSLCEGSSIWQIEQKLTYGNIFQEMKYTDTGLPVKIKHKPPPFADVLSASSAIVDTSFFKNLEPIERFLCMTEYQSIQANAICVSKTRSTHSKNRSAHSKNRSTPSKNRSTLCILSSRYEK